MPDQATLLRIVRACTHDRRTCLIEDWPVADQRAVREVGQRYHAYKWEMGDWAAASDRAKCEVVELILEGKL